MSAASSEHFEEGDLVACGSLSDPWRGEVLSKGKRTVKVICRVTNQGEGLPSSEASTFPFDKDSLIFVEKGLPRKVRDYGYRYYFLRGDKYEKVGVLLSRLDRDRNSIELAVSVLNPTDNWNTAEGVATALQNFAAQRKGYVEIPRFLREALNPMVVLSGLLKDVGASPRRIEEISMNPRNTDYMYRLLGPGAV